MHARKSYGILLLILLTKQQHTEQVMYFWKPNRIIRLLILSFMQIFLVTNIVRGEFVNLVNNKQTNTLAPKIHIELDYFHSSMMKFLSGNTPEITRNITSYSNQSYRFTQVGPDVWELKDKQTNSRLLVNVNKGFNVIGFFVTINNREYNLIYQKGGAPLLFPFANRVKLNEKSEIVWTDSKRTQWRAPLLNEKLKKADLVTQNDASSLRHGLVRKLPFHVSASCPESNWTAPSRTSTARS